MDAPASNPNPVPPEGHPAGAGGEAAVPEALIEMGVYPTPAEGFEHGLVVLSMGLSYWLVPAEGGYSLLVESRCGEAVREEIACFEREKIGWPPRPAAQPGSRWGRAMLTPLLWALSVLAVFYAQNSWPGRLEAKGAMDARAVFHDGEVWRAATALFLHGDLEHLISNLIPGIFVFTCVISVVGAGRGWLLVLTASVAGNLAVAGVHYPGAYRSLGASTSIFAGLGLLTGRAIRGILGGQAPRQWRPVLIPLASGAALLGWFGTGGVDTDVTAHAAGFAAGLILGFVAGGRAGVVLS
jgi:membrane associated rhomboid family serine protease